MPKLKFLKKEEEKPESIGSIVDQSSIGSDASMEELTQRFDKLSKAVGQCFLALDKKIDTYKDNIVVIQQGIAKQTEQHEEFKKQLQSYENKILRLLRNIRYEIETEVNTTKDSGTKKRLGKTLDKINTSLILDLIKEKGPITTSDLEDEVINRKVCSKATLFRKLKVLRSKELVKKEDKNGSVFYSVS